MEMAIKKQSHCLLCWIRTFFILGQQSPYLAAGEDILSDRPLSPCLSHSQGVAVAL
jgi:hypothetical protein